MTDLEQQLRTYVESAFAELPETTTVAVTGAADGAGFGAGTEPAAADRVDARGRVPLAAVGGGPSGGDGPARRGSAHGRRRAVGVAAAVVVALVGVVAVVAIDGDGSDPRVAAGGRDAPVAAADTDPVPSAPEEWTVDLGGEIPYAPVVVDGAVVVVSMSADFGQSTVIALEEDGWDEESTVASRRWSVDLGAPVVSQPVAAPGLVLVRLADERLVALSAADGAVRWSAGTGDNVKGPPPPVVAGSTVYVGSQDGLVQAIALADGFVRFRARLQGAVLAPPTFAVGFLFVATGDLPLGPGSRGRVYVLDPAGNEIESHRVSAPVLDSPAGRAGLVAVTTARLGGDASTVVDGGALVIFGGGSPSSHRFPDGLSAPYLFGDVVVVAWGEQLIAYRVDSSSNAEWTAAIGANQAPEAVGRRGAIVVTGGDDLIALGRRSGRQRWRAAVPDAFFGQSDDPDLIVAVSRRGALAVVDARDGSLVVDFALHDTPAGAVLHDGTLVWTGTGGVVTTARLGAEDGQSLVACTATNVEPKVPDAMPYKDSVLVDEAAARDVAERDVDVIERRFGGVRSVMARSVDMKAWARDSAGQVTVEDVRGYEIEVVLERSSDCPAAPFFLEGYPTRFYAAK